MPEYYLDQGAHLWNFIAKADKIIIELSNLLVDGRSIPLRMQYQANINELSALITKLMQIALSPSLRLLKLYALLKVYCGIAGST